MAAQNMFTIQSAEHTDLILGEQKRNQEDYDCYYYYFKIHCIQSSLRSFMHCIHRLCREYFVAVLVVMISIIIVFCSIFASQSNIGNLFDKAVSLCHCDANIGDGIYHIPSIDIEQKMEAMDSRISMIEKSVSDKLAILDQMDKIDNIDESVMNQITIIQSNIQSNIINIMDNAIDTMEQGILNKLSTMDDKVYIDDKIQSVERDINNMRVGIENEISLLKQWMDNMRNIENIESNSISDEHKFMTIKNEITILNDKMNNIEMNSCQKNINDWSGSERADFTVSVSYHTELMTASFMERIQLRLYYFFTRKYDQNAVQATFRSGDCTPLKQYNNTDNKQRHPIYIIFKLRARIHINGITIEYIHPNLLQNDTGSAPKEMSLELSKDGYHYYPYQNQTLLYNPYDGSSKYFELETPTKQRYKYVKLNVVSNHGADYTCLYRVQVHGLISY